MILITGGTGLVGSQILLQLLKEGEDVRAAYRKDSNLENVSKIFSYYVNNPKELYNKIEWVEADLLDIPALEIAFKDVKYVYHAAAYISFTPKDYPLLKKINVTGTANIVNLCIANKVTKLAYVSTIGTIGRSLPEQKATEENEWKDAHVNVYALSKFSAEMEVWRGTQEGIDAVIINPGVILGAGIWHPGEQNDAAPVETGVIVLPEARNHG